jgi:hypothetical protein
MLRPRRRRSKLKVVLRSWLRSIFMPTVEQSAAHAQTARRVLLVVFIILGLIGGFALYLFGDGVSVDTKALFAGRPQINVFVSDPRTSVKLAYEAETSPVTGSGHVGLDRWAGWPRWADALVDIQERRR